MVALASAQFQMFEQLFNQGGQRQQQQQQQQNVASDSEWYQRTYDGGMLDHFITDSLLNWPSLQLPLLLSIAGANQRYN